MSAQDALKSPLRKATNRLILNRAKGQYSPQKPFNATSKQTPTTWLGLQKNWSLTTKAYPYVAGILEEVYGINITFSTPQLKQLMFTGTFENQPIEVIMENVKAVFGVKCHRKGNHFEIHINE